MAGPSTADPLIGQLAPALLGMQMGSTVGAMSHRVLGQFDVGLPPLGQEAAYFVVPNIEAFAADHGLEVRQARLWIALHEVIHHAEFAVDWVADHFDGLIGEFVQEARIDPASLEERLGSLQDPEAMQRMMEDPTALSGLLASEEQQPVLSDIRAFMAFMEGYAEYVIDRSAAGMLPEADRLREAVDRRRAEPTQGEQMLQRVLGLDLEHHRYRRGTSFCADVDRRWGAEALDRIWEGPELLPTEDELDDVVGWAARVLL
jgi:putative hydrolase